MHPKDEPENISELAHHTEEKELQPEDGPKSEVLQPEQKDKDKNTVDYDDKSLTKPLLGPILLTLLENK